jgi:UDP-2,4-diacetamido-2,4,6-trideoxy-beta-L-altropyranose hydrolase
MNIVFRLDAAVAIGAGHLMRCLALADALRQGGASSVFILRCDIEALHAEVLARGHQCRLLPGSATDWNTDAGQTAQCLRDLPATDCLIVDHYQLDARWERMLRPLVRRIMVIDDLADRPHDCDILLDQNLTPQLQQRYVGLVPTSCQQLLGPQFAMLRPEFLLERSRLRTRDGQVRRLAVFFGGTDPGAETLKVLTALAGLPELLAQMPCDVIIGAAHPQRQRVEEICRSNAQMQFHCQINNMAELMAAADLCIGAGGTALWERAVLGVPSLVITIADNQISASTEMALAGALLYLGSAQQLEQAHLQQVLGVALNNRWLLLSLSQRSLELVDGNGLARVAAVVLGA